jgi:hypothetical protein
MERALGQDIPEENRASFLRDNCDKIEEMGYMKPFTPEEITEKKDLLSEVAIKINDIESDKKETLKNIKHQLEPLTEQKAELLKSIKTKAEWVSENCYQFINHQQRLVCYYNSQGIMVASRPTRPEETQYTLRIPRTGTDNN